MKYIKFNRQETIPFLLNALHNVMKKFLVLPFLFLALMSDGQQKLLSSYREADSLLHAENHAAAYSILQKIEPQCSTKDTLYPYIAWDYVAALTQLEKKYRLDEKFESSLRYALEALELIRKVKGLFNEKFASREYWMEKNIIVAYFGLGQSDKARKHQDILYEAYHNGQLPDGLTEHYNFSYFRWNGNNIWGYEWFEELPEDRMSKSFSKIVYYVYSTHPDGSDKDQLYRLHVLMFHKTDNSVKFDYVLTKRLETAKNEVSGTLYAYTYTKAIDYKKLEADIREVLKGNYEPDSKSIRKKP